MTRMIKIERMYRVKFDRITQAKGCIDMLAEDEEDAENKFEELAFNPETLMYEDNYQIIGFVETEHDITSIIPIETTQER